MEHSRFLASFLRLSMCVDDNVVGLNLMSRRMDVMGGCRFRPITLHGLTFLYTTTRGRAYDAIYILRIMFFTLDDCVSVPLYPTQFPGSFPKFEIRKNLEYLKSNSQVTDQKLDTTRTSGKPSLSVSFSMPLLKPLLGGGCFRRPDD